MLKPKENKIKKFIMGKGFYAVLALCLVGAGTAAWLSVNKTLGALSAGESSSLLQDPVSYYSKTDETSYVKPNTVTHFIIPSSPPEEYAAEARSAEPPPTWNQTDPTRRHARESDCHNL